MNKHKHIKKGGKVPPKTKTTMDDVVVQGHFEFSQTVLAGVDNLIAITVSPTLSEFD